MNPVIIIRDMLTRFLQSVHGSEEHKECHQENKTPDYKRKIHAGLKISLFMKSASK